MVDGRGSLREACPVTCYTHCDSGAAGSAPILDHIELVLDQVFCDQHARPVSATYQAASNFDTDLSWAS